MCSYDYEQADHFAEVALGHFPPIYEAVSMMEDRFLIVRDELVCARLDAKMLNSTQD